jgi:hypothetical protein
LIKLVFFHLDKESDREEKKRFSDLHNNVPTRGLLTVEQLFKVILKVSIKNGLVIESYNGIKHPKVPFKLRFVLCSA